ncbi:general secretion pathway protein GspL [Hylemonella gracilis str. Niagara R]|uniref:General secretion pathway protein GspL n=1 Tax=Hylemonella gracilis str. Niagara R TaxID=1458275 RepID=A0A016XG73_9BURK|nr:type II secretion system protein GspL [Hylemonella gracilis]EYC51064.1 general secretion pathway protein GspL [Hylemonella gracilis str. Niagara R]
MLLLTPSLSNTALPPATATRLPDEDWHWAQVNPYLSGPGFAIAAHGSGPSAAWPQDASVVLVVPPQRLSWHLVRLPKVPARKRLAALHGLLEEALLDDPAQLQFALPPGHPAAGTAQGLTWVATCDRAWLDACLASLRAAGRPALRIAPAFPPPADATTQLWISAETGTAWLHIGGPAGLISLPLAAFVAQDASACATLLSAAQGKTSASVPPVCTATPDAMAEAQAALPALPWKTEPQAQQWLRGVNSGWNLAQFELRDALGARRGQALLERLKPFWQAPRWRPLRWGAAALVMVQIIGLHTWAWRDRAALRALRLETQRTATQTFPKLTVVLDAPRQMQRELDAMRHGAGQLGPADLESLLQAMGATPALAGLQLESLRYSAREVRLRHAPGEPVRAALALAAARQGWTLQAGSGGTPGSAGTVESVLKRD